jgi:hypothetical protein
MSRLARRLSREFKVMRSLLWIRSFSLLASLVLSVQSVAEVSPRKPNLVWIWADNLAYGDLGVYGNQEIETPVIDGLAESGVRKE